MLVRLESKHISFPKRLVGTLLKSKGKTNTFVNSKDSTSTSVKIETLVKSKTNTSVKSKGKTSTLVKSKDYTSTLVDSKAYIVLKPGYFWVYYGSTIPIHLRISTLYTNPYYPSHCLLPHLE
jgi:hypothetical protein